MLARGTFTLPWFADFFETGGPCPEVWSAQGAFLGFGADLELAAVETALGAALPGHLYAAVIVSPATCLDRRLEVLVRASPIPLNLIVFELTEQHPVTDYLPLKDALASLREAGLWAAVDDAEAG